MKSLYDAEEIKKQIEEWDKKLFSEDADEVEEAYRKKCQK